MLSKITIVSHDRAVWLLETLRAAFQFSFRVREVLGVNKIAIVFKWGTREIEYDLEAVSNNESSELTGSETPRLKAAFTAINDLPDDPDAPEESPAHADQVYMAFGYREGLKRDISERLRNAENDFEAIDEAATLFGCALKEVVLVDEREDRVVRTVWAYGSMGKNQVGQELGELLDRNDIQFEATPAAARV